MDGKSAFIDPRVMFEIGAIMVDLFSPRALFIFYSTHWNREDACNVTYANKPV